MPKIIARDSKEVLEEEHQDIFNRTCPKCQQIASGQFKDFSLKIVPRNGKIIKRKIAVVELYRCRRCRTEWYSYE